MARIVGLDPGTRRIGVAIADTTTGIATPFAVWEKSEWRAEISALLAEDSVTTIVVGHPRPLAGGRSESSARAVEFANELREAVETEVVLYDERFTSKIAERELLERGVKRRRRREVLDKLAATVMLQSYLDSHP